MNEIFYEKWIGRGGPVAWTPRSPDLTLPDYFLWGFVRERVMVAAPTAPGDMKERIRRACTEIAPQMLAEIRRSFHQRIYNCLQVGGHHFEHLLVVDPNQGLGYSESEDYSDMYRFFDYFHTLRD